MKVSTLLFPVLGDDIFLAIKKAKVGAGLYNGWGGKLEPKDGGDVKVAACREFLEESGAVAFPADLELMAVVSFFEGGRPIFECHVFFCRNWLGELRESDQMGPPVRFPLQSLPYRQMMLGDRIWFSTIIAGAKFFCWCYYSEGNKEVLKMEFEPFRD